MVNPFIIQKRDGSTEEFSSDKLAASIQKALQASKSKKHDAVTAAALAEKVHVQIVRIFSVITARSSDIQDIVADTFTKAGNAKAAAAYVTARDARAKTQKFRTVHGIRDELGLTSTGIATLSHYYLMRNENGSVVETPGQMFRRVAKTITQAERQWDAAVLKKFEESLYDALANRELVMSSTIMSNAGLNNDLLPNLMISMPDDLSGIFRALAEMVDVIRRGSSVSVSLDDVRHRGALIKSTKTTSTGPVSFLRLFDDAADIITESARRKTANMAVMRVDHPDILEFISMSGLKNFKRGVLVTDTFMKAAAENADWPLVDLMKKEVRKVNAAELLTTLLSAVHATGDPALIFVDAISAVRPLSTTPCPSQPLMAFQSVPQAVVNLAVMVDRGHIAWDKLRKSVALAVRALDDVIEVTQYPNPMVQDSTKAYRTLGIGVMGLAELLVGMNIVYGSKKAFDTTDKVMKFIADEARKESAILGKARGSYPLHADPKKPMRNAGLLTVTPTGILCSIGPASSGIEPLGAIVKISDAKTLEINPLFERLMRAKGAYSPALMCKLAKSGTLVADVPKDIRSLFTHDLPLETHLKLQIAVQKHVDNGVGKALHVAPEMKILDVRKLVLLAHKSRAKSIWFHRGDGACRGCGI